MGWPYRRQAWRYLPPKLVTSVPQKALDRGEGGVVIMAEGDPSLEREHAELVGPLQPGKEGGVVLALAVKVKIAPLTPVEAKLCIFTLVYSIPTNGVIQLSPSSNRSATAA